MLDLPQPPSPQIVMVIFSASIVLFCVVLREEEKDFRVTARLYCQCLLCVLSAADQAAELPHGLQDGGMPRYQQFPP